MKFLYDILPFFVFFVVYKFYDIFMATAVVIAIFVTQVAITLIRGKRLEFMHLMTFLIVVTLGGATLIFQNEMFIKWKPTAVYWILGLAFGISQWIFKKNLVQKMLAKSLDLPEKAWSMLNTTWVTFFLLMGIINLIVVYSFSTSTWVNFKVFGTLILTVLFVLIQGVMVSRFMPSSKPKEKNASRSLDPQ